MPRPMAALLGLLLLSASQAAPPDARAFIRKFDDLVKAKKYADAVKYFDANQEAVKDSPEFVKAKDRLLKSYEDARASVYRKTTVYLDFEAPNSTGKIQGSGRVIKWADGKSCLDVTPMPGKIDDTFIFMPEGMRYTVGAYSWMDIELYYEGPKDLAYIPLDIRGPRAGKPLARTELRLTGFESGKWVKKTCSIASFALDTWAKMDKRRAEDGDSLTELVVVLQLVKGVQRLAFRSIHFYEEDKHESGNLPLNALDAGGQTRLHRAAMAGDLKKVNELIAKSADVMAKNQNGIWSGETPLHLAAMNGHAPVVAALLAAKADPNAEAPGQKSLPLRRAAFFGHAEAVRTLLKGGARMDLNEGWNSSLYKALLMDRAKVLEAFLDNGVPVDAALENKSLLQIAGEGFYGEPSVECLKLLSTRGAKGDLFTAAMAGDAAQVTKLAKADPASVNRPVGGRTALFAAAKAGQAKVVQALLAARADPNIPCDGKMTALHIVCVREPSLIREHAEVARLLIAARCDLNAVDEKGHTPLYVAQSTSFPEMADLVRKAGGVSK